MIDYDEAWEPGYDTPNMYDDDSGGIDPDAERRSVYDWGYPKLRQSAEDCALRRLESPMYELTDYDDGSWEWRD